MDHRYSAEKIGYRGLVVSDDLEMGGVLKAAPIEQAAVEHIRAGGDFCLICQIEEYIIRSYESAREQKWTGSRNFRAARGNQSNRAASIQEVTPKT